MSELPYYISWTKQAEATTFPIDSVNGVTIKSGSIDLIDMSSISYQAHFGHNHPVIIKKIKEQLDSIPLSSPKGIYPKKNETTKALLAYMNRPDGKIFYTSGGAETVENALKIARDITKKRLVLARQNSYHGATMGALTVTGDWRNTGQDLPRDWVVRIPEPQDIDAIKKTRMIIEEHGNDQFAAIIIETITGGNGVYSGNQEWWDGISKICRDYNILLIMDEVVCGFERTGKPFGYMHYHVEPDMICLAKGITGGMIPFGALWTSKKIAEYYQNNILSCGLTNYAHPLGVAALSGVLEIVQDNDFLENLKRIETLFSDHLKSFTRLGIVKDYRLQGMLCAIDLNKTIDWKKFYQEGIYLVAQKERIILAPPLIITESELNLAMNKIKKVLDSN